MSAALLALLLAAQTYDVLGPHAYDSALDTSLAIPSGAITADLYWPTTATVAAPVVVIGHGFGRNKNALTNWGAHFASYGFVAIVPSFPNPLAPDHVANALRMRELIPFVRATPGAITAAIDPAKDAILGHSAGGLSAFLAAAADPSIEVVVGLDPVDANGLAAGAAPMIAQPMLVLGAEAAQCNANGSASTLYPLLTSAGSWYLRVANSTHCDGEDPSGLACTALCGGEDLARRALYRRYATAHVIGWLFCEAPPASYLPGGTGLMNDLSAGTVEDFAAIAGAPCTTPPPSDAGTTVDSGMSGEDAGTSTASDDAGTTADAGQSGDDAAAGGDAAENEDATAGEDATASAPDAGVSAANDAGTAPSDAEEDSCGCKHAAPSASGVWLGALLLFYLARRSLT